MKVQNFRAGISIPDGARIWARSGLRAQNRRVRNLRARPGLKIPGLRKPGLQNGRAGRFRLKLES